MILTASCVEEVRAEPETPPVADAIQAAPAPTSTPEPMPATEPATVPAPAQQADRTFAVVDLELFQSKMPLMQQKLKLFNDRQDELTNQIMAKQDEVDELHLNLRHGRIVWSEDQTASKTAELSTQQMQLERMRQDTQYELLTLQNSIENEIRLDALKSIEAFRAAQGYGAIFTTQAMLSYDPALDVTDQIIATLE
tara:strand:- start:308 stop:895 length:588 start_codon:yes stop_codon:yes gene_type:complete